MDPSGTVMVICPDHVLRSFWGNVRIVFDLFVFCLWIQCSGETSFPEPKTAPANWMVGRLVFGKAFWQVRTVSFRETFILFTNSSTVS